MQIKEKPISEVRKTIVDFVKSEYENGRTVNFLDIIKKFRIGLPYYFKDPREIYISAGVEVPTKLLYRDDIRKEIIKFFKDYYRVHGMPPTKKYVRKELHVEIYNYFKNIKEICTIAEIRPNLRSIEIKARKKFIVDFIKDMANKKKYPLTKEVETRFRIQLKTYFNKPYLLNAYKEAEVDYRKALKERKKRILDSRERRKIFKTAQEGRDAIAKYITNSAKKGKYPTYKEIINDMGIAFYRYFSSVEEAYRYAEVDYKRTHIFLAREKEKKLTIIVMKLLENLGWKISRVSIFAETFRNKGIDILALDNEKRLVGIEIKAYHKSESITIKEIQQTQRNKKNHKCDYCIIITTTNNIPKRVLREIKIWKCSKIVGMLRKAKMHENMRELMWIRHRIIEVEKRDLIKNKRKEIASHVKYLVENNHNPTKKELEKFFKIDIRTYFKSLGEIYEFANLPIPVKLLTKEQIKDKSE